MSNVADSEALGLGESEVVDFVKERILKDCFLVNMAPDNYIKKVIHQMKCVILYCNNGTAVT